MKEYFVFNCIFFTWFIFFSISNYVSDYTYINVGVTAVCVFVELCLCARFFGCDVDVAFPAYGAFFCYVYIRYINDDRYNWN